MHEANVSALRLSRVALVLAASGCWGEPPWEHPPVDAGPDAASDGDAGDGSIGGPDDGAVEYDTGAPCCPIDPTPGCCMQYGGSARLGFCGVVCDGMPYPNNPAWRLVTDTDGCPRWTSEGAVSPCCGEPPVNGDAGPYVPHPCF